jgi:hypothetical protein
VPPRADAGAIVADPHLDWFSDVFEFEDEMIFFVPFELVF